MFCLKHTSKSYFKEHAFVGIMACGLVKYATPVRPLKLLLLASGGTHLTDLTVSSFILSICVCVIKCACVCLFFCCGPLVTVVGLVEELVVDNDPEYQWMDNFRQARTSNESRQSLLFKLDATVRRQLGKKVQTAAAVAVYLYIYIYIGRCLPPLRVSLFFCLLRLRVNLIDPRYRSLPFVPRDRRPFLNCVCLRGGVRARLAYILSPYCCEG